MCIRDRVTNDYLGQMHNDKVRSKLNFVKKDLGKYKVPVISSQVVDNKDFFEGNYLALLSSVYADLFYKYGN